MDGGAWWAAVHGVTKSRTQLSEFTSQPSEALIMGNVVLGVRESATS